MDVRKAFFPRDVDCNGRSAIEKAIASPRFLGLQPGAIAAQARGSSVDSQWTAEWSEDSALDQSPGFYSDVETRRIFE